MKYRVFGHTTVTVAVEVSADNEKDALEVALDQLSNLTAFSGNGGCDKLVRVYGDDESVAADEEIVYDDAELIGPDDPDDEDEDDD